MCQAVYELAVRAYPEIPEEARDRLEKNHFVDPVSDQFVREGIFLARPKDLTEALQAALDTENFHKVEAHRTMEKLGKFARGSGRDEDERIQLIERTLSQQSKCVNNLSQQMDKMLGVNNRRSRHLVWYPENSMVHSLL